MPFMSRLRLSVWTMRHVISDEVILAYKENKILLKYQQTFVPCLQEIRLKNWSQRRSIVVSIIPSFEHIRGPQLACALACDSVIGSASTTTLPVFSATRGGSSSASPLVFSVPCSDVANRGANHCDNHIFSILIAPIVYHTTA